jgi:cobalt/nickel transport system permease protein
MPTQGIWRSLRDFRELDAHAKTGSPLQRLDARAQVLVTAAFLVAVISQDRHAVSGLLALAIFPISVWGLSGLPAGFLLRRLVYVLPFALLVGLPNPWFDHEVLLRLGALEVTGGWMSLLSIILRSLMAAAAALLLVAITGFPALSQALGRLGMPQALVLQLLLLYRFLTVLGEEALRMRAAHAQRSPGQRMPLRQHAALVGHLLLRTWGRAERLHLAMRARGFDGQLPTGRRSRWGWQETFWMAGWILGFWLLRAHDLPGWAGQALLHRLQAGNAWPDGV